MHSFVKILNALQENPCAAGGACNMSFANKNIKTRMVAGLNNLRALLTGISFGDQAQFFRIEALDQLGGFPKLILMEDVELSLRLKQTGRLLLLKTVKALRLPAFIRRYSTFLPILKRFFSLSDNVGHQF